MTSFYARKSIFKNCSKNTLRFYDRAYKTYRKVIESDAVPTQESLNDFIVRQREREMSVGCLNVHIRGMRAFVRWLITKKYADVSLRLSELRDAKKVLRSFTDEELIKFIKFRPKTFTERRTHTLVLLLIDTGVRIDEALSLTRDDLDFDNLMIKVQGKGSKERLVPMSYELRAAFIRFLNLSVHKFELVFPTRKGTRQYYGDVYRMFTKLCRRLGIKPIGFHCCRRIYARNYLKSGGNLFYLQTSMGHSKLETTRRYVEVEPEALKKAHLQTSTLSRLK